MGGRAGPNRRCKGFIGAVWRIVRGGDPSEADFCALFKVRFTLFQEAIQKYLYLNIMTDKN